MKKLDIRTSSGRLTKAQQAMMLELVAMATRQGIDELTISFEVPPSERGRHPPEQATKSSVPSRLTIGDNLAVVIAVIALIYGAIIQVAFDEARILLPDLWIPRLVMLAILFLTVAWLTYVVYRKVSSWPDE